MARYDPIDYLSRLKLQPVNGVYTFKFDQGSDVQSVLVEDLLMGDPMPENGQTVKITTTSTPKGDKPTGIEVVPKGGKRRRYRKKTRRSKKRRMTRRR